MTDTTCILSLDQGTTSSRAILFDSTGAARHTAQQEFAQHFPQDGWVEHDGEEIWQTTLSTAKNALAFASQHGLKIAAIGITNQRETTLVWERATGKPISRAIVWQDRRTASTCQELKQQGGGKLEKSIQAKTGLLLDPYFSATKIKWILDNVAGARAKAAAGELAFGTVDSFLIWRLTGGKVHASDATNASRTMLFNIHGQKWDTDILTLLDIPPAMLPEVLDCAADYGSSDKAVLGAAIPIAGVAGDQQAALMGQACFAAGMGKATFGTGAFMIVNTGGKALTSKNKLLTTIAYRLGGKVAYGVEGSIFIAGSGVQWLRDGLGVIGSAGETEGMAAGLESNHGIYIVPAFTGLGAPYWDAAARGGIFGITRDTQPAHLARAMLEAVCYQTHDLLAAMGRDGLAPTKLRVDGGMVANDWLCQYLADILGISVERPQIIETTALGAAFLAGLQVGVYGSLTDCAATWQSEAVFASKMEKARREQLLGGWQAAVAKVRSQ